MKVGHRQAFIPQNPIGSRLWGFVFVATKTWRQKAWSESLSRGATNTTIQKSPWAAAPPRGFCLGIKHGIRSGQRRTGVVLPVDAVTLELVVERLAGNAQRFQRGTYIALMGCERFADELGFDAFHLFGQGARRRIRDRCRAGGGIEHTQDEAFGKVGQFADIARPVVGQQMMLDVCLLYTSDAADE